MPMPVCTVHNGSGGHCHQGNNEVLDNVLGDIFHHIFYPAIEDSTEHFNGMGTYAFITFQAGQLTRAHIEFMNQCVL